MSSLPACLILLVRHHCWRMYLAVILPSTSYASAQGRPFPKPPLTAQFSSLTPPSLSFGQGLPVMCGLYCRPAHPGPVLLSCHLTRCACCPAGWGALASDLGPCVLWPAHLLAWCWPHPRCLKSVGSWDRWGFPFFEVDSPQPPAGDSPRRDSLRRAPGAGSLKVGSPKDGMRAP